MIEIYESILPKSVPVGSFIKIPNKKGFIFAHYLPNVGGWIQHGLFHCISHGSCCEESPPIPLQEGCELFNNDGDVWLLETTGWKMVTPPTEIPVEFDPSVLKNFPQGTVIAIKSGIDSYIEWSWKARVGVFDKVRVFCDRPNRCNNRLPNIFYFSKLKYPNGNVWIFNGVAWLKYDDLYLRDMKDVQYR